MDRSGHRAVLELVCQWVARLATASLCAYWIVLRGGIVLGLFPAMAALLAQSRRWLSGQVAQGTWGELSDLARRDFRIANLAGLAALVPALLTGGLTYAAMGSLPPAIFVAALALLIALPTALALGAWADVPGRALAVGAWILALHAPLRSALAAAGLIAAAALTVIHPLLALYFGPALGALMVTASLQPMLKSPLLSLAPAPIGRQTPRIAP